MSVWLVCGYALLLAVFGILLSVKLYAPHL
jgi:hypothetical protein